MKDQIVVIGHGAAGLNHAIGLHPVSAVLEANDAFLRAQEQLNRLIDDYGLGEEEKVEAFELAQKIHRMTAYNIYEAFRIVGLTIKHKEEWDYLTSMDIPFENKISILESNAALIATGYQVPTTTFKYEIQDRELVPVAFKHHPDDYGRRARRKGLTDKFSNRIKPKL